MNERKKKKTEKFEKRQRNDQTPKGIKLVKVGRNYCTLETTTKSETAL